MTAFDLSSLRGCGNFYIAFAVVFFLARSLMAEGDCAGSFREAPTSEPGTVVTQISLALDSASNAFAAGVTDDTLLFGVVGNGGSLSPVNGFDGGAEADPSFAAAAGAMKMVLTQVKAGQEAFGREVFVTRRAGTNFTDTQNISNNRVDDYAASLVLDASGDQHVVWAQRSGVSSRVMYWNENLSEAQEVVAVGDLPVLFIDAEGSVHIAYLRDNDVFYTNNVGGDFASGQSVTTSPLASESSLGLGVDRDGVVVVVYESAHSLYLAVKTAADFEAPQLLVLGGVLDPTLRFYSDGLLVLAYTQNGDVYYVLGTADALTAPVALTQTTEVESQPTVDIDRNGILHATFLREGVVYYANNACVPKPDFDADIFGGRAPLVVQFTDQTDGLVSFWAWDFGDGNVSTSRDPVHVYQRAGTFTVTLRVWGPGGVSSEVVKESFIDVDLAINSFRLVNQRVLPGDTDVWMPVYATIAEAFQGYQLMARFDPNFLDLVRMDLSLTILESEGLDPDFELLNDKGFFFEVGVLLEIRQPFENLSIPPVIDKPIANMVFNVLPTATPDATTQVTLRDDPTISDILNRVIVNGFNRAPALVSADVAIASDPTLVPFLRAEVTGDGSVDISDGIAILNFLFSSDQSVQCLDAADFDDNGRLNIGDPVSLFNYLFASGDRPSPPFPRQGLDPTPDDALGECR